MRTSRQFRETPQRTDVPLNLSASASSVFSTPTQSASGQSVPEDDSDNGLTPGDFDFRHFSPLHEEDEFDSASFNFEPLDTSSQVDENFPQSNKKDRVVLNIPLLKTGFGVQHSQKSPVSTVTSGSVISNTVTTASNVRSATTQSASPPVVTSQVTSVISGTSDVRSAITQSGSAPVVTSEVTSVISTSSDVLPTATTSGSAPVVTSQVTSAISTSSDVLSTTTESVTNTTDSIDTPQTSNVLSTTSSLMDTPKSSDVVDLTDNSSPLSGITILDDSPVKTEPGHQPPKRKLFDIFLPPSVRAKKVKQEKSDQSEISETSDNDQTKESSDTDELVPVLVRQSQLKKFCKVEKENEDEPAIVCIDPSKAPSKKTAK